MVNLKILDTGYVSNSTLGSQTQLSDANRSGYTGSAVAAFDLNVEGNISISGGVNTEEKPIIGTLTDNSSSLVSSNNRTIQISCTLTRDIVTSGYNVNNVIELSRLERTHGLKLLYPSATGDSMPTVVEALGQENLAGVFSDGSPTDDAGTVATTTPYLVGRVKNFRFNDSTSSRNLWRFSFDFVISA